MFLAGRQTRFFVCLFLLSHFHTFSPDHQNPCPRSFCFLDPRVEHEDDGLFYHLHLPTFTLSYFLTLLYTIPMFRDLVSYLVLILVPVISLTIAIAPFVWVKRKITHSHLHTFTPSNVPTVPPSHTHPWISTPRLTARLWLAFVIGLVGNVVWWWLVGDVINSERISMYLWGTNDDGIMFSFFLYSFFVVITPFIFYKLKHGHFSRKAIVYNIIVSLIVAGLVLGVWILLAINAYRGIFEQLN